MTEDRTDWKYIGIVLAHDDVLCRPDKRKNDDGIKWWCCVCRRYVKGGARHIEYHQYKRPEKLTCKNPRMMGVISGEPAV